MPQRTAPPFWCYLWYFLWRRGTLWDNTPNILSCRRTKQTFRIIYFVSAAWLRALIIASGLFVYWFASYSHWIYKALIVLLTLLAALFSSGLYSYCRTEFEELSDEAVQDG